MSEVQSAVRKAIPLCGIVLVLGCIARGHIGVGIDLPMSRKVVGLAGSSSAQPEPVALVQAFLKNVPENRRSTFDDFFADDVLYTRGTGKLITKKDILADSGNATAPRANATYSGEDFTVHQYGDMAVVNFRLVMHATENEKPVTRMFRNTGTFMRRNATWQAVAWQATPIVEEK